MQNEDYNGSSLMEMMPDEAMMEQLAAAKNFPRKMMNNLDVANLLKQVQSSNAQHLQHHKMTSPSSAHSISPRPPSPSQHMLIAPVAPTTSSAVEPST